ncbi:MAG: valine--tRNA ligase [Erysipelotrichaceae bacterium]|nr:valine--tRNA ligase [Erysipelotrichaceae bacterium]
MLDQKYDAGKVEAGKHAKWIEKGYFTAKGDPDKKPYTIVIPPPNVTGKLHLGHAFDTAIQDSLCRYHRLKGEDVLYLPGMDHAGIATQAKVDARLKEQGISRYDIGREAFLQKAWEWKSEYADTIHKQWEKLGLSVDYTRERFTLDEGLSAAVKEVFVRYYKEGLIYQGKRIINWDPEAKTALSNIEVIHKEVEGRMYYFRYHLTDSDETFDVATTRPETMFGDVCVVVHPKDEKLNHLIGKQCINPANGDVLPIIGDEYIEIGFGTGAMKCTPAHDPNDYEIALRHGLPMPICMNEDGTMNELCGEYEGLDRFECRKRLTARIESEGNFVKEEKIVHNVGHSERTGVMVEPYLSKQWFVRMKPLAEDVLAHQQDPETKMNFYPPRFEHTFAQWLENIEDWCISRQLWWGHRIPVYYHKETGEIYCEVEPPKDIENWTQDEDVLDTWFSSALWPFSTLGWPDEDAPDLKRYFPTSTMGTGYDILFFWVARMAFSARHFMKDIPFKDVVLHGLIRDEQGRKMSKSLGNGIDPMDVIDQYGCDSLRFFLLTNSTPGLDMNYSTEKIEASWNFINKLWNAARYVLLNLPEGFERKTPEPHNPIDHWILRRLNETMASAAANIERYELAMAGNELYRFVWEDFCSSYIEFTKSALNGEDEVRREETRQMLAYLLEAIVCLLSPYIPFVTEELYQALNGEETSVNEARWPEAIAYDKEKADAVEILIEIIRETRALRSENDLKPSRKLEAVYEGKLKIDESLQAILTDMCKLQIIEKLEGETMVRPLKDGSLSFRLADIVDKEAELAKIEKELQRLQKEIARSRGILSNPGFLAKAPEAKINEEKEKQASYESAYATLLNKKKELAS